MRIVSLLPSATELLCLAGGENLLVGRSHECDFPPAITHLPVLTRARTRGGTSSTIDAEVRAARGENRSLYELDQATLHGLKPDLILTQDLCHVCSIDLATVRTLAASLHPPPTVLSLNPTSLDDVFDDLLRIGDAIGRESEARRALVDLRARYWQARDVVNPYLDGPRIAFLEWMDPLFIAGHWTPALIHDAGGRHPLNATGSPSRMIVPQELIGSDPDRIIVSPCGFDLARIRKEWASFSSQPWWNGLRAVQHGAVALVDGNQMFSRPGPRLVDAFEWLVGWIHERHHLAPPGFPAAEMPPIARGPALHPR